MVHLILTSTNSKGNGLRYFPFEGCLGLTPVKVSGVVLTRCDNDEKLLSARSITISVRCYEYRVGRVGIVQSNRLVDYTQILWAKPEGQEYADLGEIDLPFRITIPVRVGGFSTTTLVDYRCVWRVEAVLNHVPKAGVGARQVKHSEMLLVRHDLPKHMSTPRIHDDSEPELRLETNKPRIRYCINTPSQQPVGPHDLLSVPILLRPIDSKVAIRSASLIIERRLKLNSVISTAKSSSLKPHDPLKAEPPTPSSSFSSSSSSPSPIEGPPSDFIGSTPSLDSTTSSNPTITPHTIYPFSQSAAEMQPLVSSESPEPPPEVHPSKLIVHPVATAESSGPFTLSASGNWSKTLTIQWPTAKSNSRWAVGETTKSDMASVRFYIRVKITVATSAGVEVIELDEKELFVTSINESERKLALAKYREASESRSKSKSPRRSHKDKTTEEPPLPTPDSAHFQTASTSAAPQKQKPSVRRPHTSAGPRDKSRRASPPRQSLSQENSYERDAARSKTKSGSNDVERSLGSSFRRWNSARAEMASGKKGISGYPSSPRISPANSSGSTSATSTSSTSSSQSEDVKEWEEELAKIEVQSQRSSSNMLKFVRHTLLQRD